MNTTASIPSYITALASSLPPIEDANKEDKLDAIRSKLSYLIELDAMKENAEERLKTLNKEIYALQHEALPEMFMEAGVVNLTLAASGNMPSVDFSMSDYFKANISAEWEEDKRAAAFDYLVSNGHGDLIQTEVKVYFPKERHADAMKLAEMLRKKKLEVEVKSAIPWATLTAWLKEQVTKYKYIPDLDKIGGTVSKLVKVQTAKKKR